VELLVLVALMVLVALLVLVALVVLREPAKTHFEVLHESLCLSPIICPGVVDENVLVLHCSDLVGFKV
jgi:hypothetical protein